MSDLRDPLQEEETLGPSTQRALPPSPTSPIDETEPDENFLQQSDSDNEKQGQATTGYGREGFGVGWAFIGPRMW